MTAIPAPFAITTMYGCKAGATAGRPYDGGGWHHHHDMHRCGEGSFITEPRRVSAPLRFSSSRRQNPPDAPQSFSPYSIVDTTRTVLITWPS